MTTPTDATINSAFVTVEGMRLHYRWCGSHVGSNVGSNGGPAILLLHGWPTSSYLWRRTMPPMARHNRVIALDLPGFGQSGKPLDASYSFRFYERVLTGVLDALEITDVGLAVHDLGGPIGLYWALRNQDRVRSLALLNTLAYPELSLAVIAFVVACRVPGARALITSPWGLKTSLKIGLADQRHATPEVIAAVLEPFASADARRALQKTGYSLHPGGFKEIARLLPTFKGPVRIIYGARDRILPNVGKTMAHVARDLPQTETTVLDDCGHFLQEERGEEIGELLATFFGGSNANP